MGGKGSGRKPLPCGTAAAYRAHRRRGEEACRACKDAFAAYYRSKRTQKARKPKLPGTTRTRRGAANKALVRQWKLDKGACMDCGLVIDERTVICIDCDHRDPAEKSFTISYELELHTVEEMQAELDKCDAVCRNCHALRTHDNQHHLARRPKTQIQVGLFDEL